MLALCSFMKGDGDAADSANWGNVLPFPFILCIKLSPSMEVADGAEMISAGYTIFSRALAKVALFVR